MKFILFVEGYTEDKSLPKFLKKWLDSRLKNPVGIKTVRFEGWHELVKDAPLKAKMYLNGPAKEDIIAVISLLDLYGPTFYPDKLTEYKERYDWAKKYIEEKVDQQKFFQFFAVHEVEAWLLSQPEIFPVNIKKAFPKKIQYPETVNFDEPPAKLLERLYSLHINRSYKKGGKRQGVFRQTQSGRCISKMPQTEGIIG